MSLQDLTNISIATQKYHEEKPMIEENKAIIPFVSRKNKSKTKKLCEKCEGSKEIISIISKTILDVYAENIILQKKESELNSELLKLIQDQGDLEKRILNLER